MNLASRMEGLAEPGTTCVSEETFKRAEGFFRFKALGEKKIKGKAKPVRIYRFIAPSTRATRFDVSAERGLTPFVGRQGKGQGGRVDQFLIIGSLVEIYEQDFHLALSEVISTVRCRCYRVR